MQCKHTASLTAEANADKDYELSKSSVKCVMQTLTALLRFTSDIPTAFDAVTQHCNYCLFSQI